MSDIPFHLQADSIRHSGVAPARNAGLRLWLIGAWVGHAVLLAALLRFAPSSAPLRAGPDMVVQMLFVPAASQVTSLPAVALAPPRAIQATLGLANPGRTRIAARDMPTLRRFAARPQTMSAQAMAPPRPRPATTPGTKSAPAETAPSPGLLAALQARIHDAVQLATVYPASARMMHREGQAQIQFDYVDGEVGGLAIAISSQSPLLDRAALEAVRHAAYPKAPGEIGRARLRLAVWVRFALTQG